MFRVLRISRILTIVGSSASQSGVKFGISWFSTSKSQLLPNSFVASQQFRTTCAFDGRRFYSMKNLVQDSYENNIGTVSFMEVVGSTNFVDKTLFIQRVIECQSKNLLISAPRRFGKSINLDMLRCFLDNDDYYEVFKKLNIGNTAYIKYCGSHPVLWLNFKKSGNISSYEKAVSVCRNIIHTAFRQHQYLLTSSKINDDLKDYCRIWCHPIAYNTLDECQLVNGLERLAECLYLYNGRKSYILIDEFDSIYTAAFSRVSADTLADIVELYAGIVDNAIKHTPEFVERAVITGILRMMCGGLSSALNNVYDYPFCEETDFSDCYGITEEEFAGLLLKENNRSVRNEGDKAIKYYSGYSWNNKRIMNTYSVVRFLERKELKPYWIRPNIAELEPENTCRVNLVRDCIENLIGGSTVAVANIPFTSTNFKSFYEDFNHPQQNRIEDISPLLRYYFQLGYLSIEDCSSDHISLKIPNVEIRSFFLKSLQTYFDYTFGGGLVDESAHLLRKLNVADEKNCLQTLTSICENLDIMCNKGIYKNLMNEAIFHEMMFAIFYSAEFEPTSEVKVHKSGQKYRKYDLCARSLDGAGILIEFEIDTTANKALQKLLTKNYFESLKQRNISQQFVLVGINLNKKNEENSEHRISISFLRNSRDMKNKVEIIL